MTKEQKYDLLTNQNVKKVICKMAIPTIISMLITSLYNMADSFFVSSLGSGAIGAVGVVFSLMAIIQACGFFFGHGSGNYISRKLGNKQVDDAKYMAATGFYTSLAFGILIAILGLIFITPFAIFLGSDDVILPYAKIYLVYILIGAPFLCSSHVMNNQLRFQGNALYGMIGMGTGAVLNILGDFVLVKFMGIHGVGLATLMSQIIGFIILRIGVNKFGEVRISIKNYRFSKELYFQIINGGSPSLLRQGIGSIATICLNNICKQYGTDVVGAMSVVNRITHLPFSIIIGFGQGFQPVCGYNYGAKKYGRVKEGFFFTAIVSFVALTILSSLCFIFAEQLVTIFCKQGDKIENLDLFMDIGVSTLRAHCITLPLLSINGTTSMLLQTMGKSIRASILAISRQGLFFIPTLYILGQQVTGIKFIQPVSDIFTLVITIVVAIPVIKMLIQKQKEENYEKKIVC